MGDSHELLDTEAHSHYFRGTGLSPNSVQIALLMKHIARYALLCCFLYVFCVSLSAQLTLPVFEDFESLQSCNTSCNAPCAIGNGFSNTSGDNGNWLVDQGGTSSASTGPTTDHTLANPIGKYVYFESSSPCFPVQSAFMLSPLVDLSQANAPTLSFWYHQYGATMGTLHLDASTNGGASWSFDIVPFRTQNVDNWQEWVVDLSAYAGDTLQIRWRGITGGSFTSDMAIDDIHFDNLLDVDAGISAIDSPATSACIYTSDVWVRLENFGVDTLTNVQINLAVNGSTVGTQAWSGSLAHATSISVPFPSVSYNIGDQLSAWTSLPNGQAELAGGHVNDTTTVLTLGGLNGTYTLGGPSADYPTFNAAITDLVQNGVCGPTEFLVNSNTYMEQITLYSIPGASAINTITFRSSAGNPSAATLLFASTISTANFTILFSNADYFRFKDMTIGATGTSFGHVLTFGGGSDHNEIENCIITGVTMTSTNLNMAAIYSPGGTSSTYNTFRGNRVNNGSQGIHWRGASTAARDPGNRFINNEFVNFYYKGLECSYQDEVEINGNQFETNSPYQGAIWRIYVHQSHGAVKIINNRIIGPQDGYGIYVSTTSATLSQPGYIANNFVRVGAPTSTTTAQGIYMINSGGIVVGHNNILMTNLGVLSRGLYISTGGNNKIYNNNIYQTGPGFAIQINSGFSVTEMDHNNLYAPSGTVGYWNGNQSTLADWQNATFFDSSSVSVNPQYFSLDDLHICNDSLKAVGIALGAVDLERDIDGEIRPLSAPDIGADQFFLPSPGFLGPDLSLCMGDTLLIQAGSVGDVIMWSTGSSDPILQIATPGTYSVQVNGQCASGSDTLVVTASNLTYADFIYTDTLTACIGDSIKLTSTQPGSYLWSTGATQNNIQVTQPGSYSLDLSDNCGSGSDTVTTTFIASPTADFSHQVSGLVVLFTDLSQTGGATSTYLWDFDDNTQLDSRANPGHVYSQAGAYLITLIVQNVCGSDTLTRTIYVGIDARDEALLDAGITLFPNPSQGELFIKYSGTDQPKGVISLMDLQGKTLLQHAISLVQGKEHPLQVSLLPKGVYLIRITIEDRSFRRKVVLY